MNNDERDNMMIEMHGDIKVLVSQGSEHHQTLYGVNGVVDRMILLQERQDQCPARRANLTENKRLGIARIVIVIAIATILINVAFQLWNALK